MAADTSSGKVVGTASLLVERKFIRGCGKVSHHLLPLCQGLDDWATLHTTCLHAVTAVRAH